MRKILFIGLVVTIALISGCFQPNVNLNTTVQQQGGATPAAISQTPSPSPVVTTPAITTPAVTTPMITATSTTSSVVTIAVTLVDIKNYEFSPVTINISKGQTVTWTNTDSVPHTVTSINNDFDSGPISPGQTFSYTFNTVGTFEYYCTIHPNIPHGKVVVTG